MNILIIQDQLRIGGTERQSLFMAKTFQEKGHESVLLLFRPGGHLATATNLDNLNTCILQSFDSGISLWAPGLRKMVQQISPDIILCMGRSANCYAGSLQKKFPDIPVVGTVRTGKKLFWLHKRSLPQLRSIIVNSSWWKESLIKEGIPREKIHVVYNALLQDCPHKNQEQLALDTRSNLGATPEDCVFLNVATFRSGKRHMDLLQGLAKLRDKHPDIKWKMWMVGDGPKMESCQMWVAENAMESIVRFTGYQKDPSAFYAGADISVSTSREDSLPNFLIESQACGLPVVAYDCRGVRETCIPGETGVILDAGDRLGLVDSLAELAENRDKRLAFSTGAQAFAQQRFSRSRQVDETLNLMENLINPAE